jgi:hypothetical protein
MLPALQTSGDKVAAIEIEQGGKMLKIAEKDGKWVVASQEDYPANFEAVRGLAARRVGSRTRRTQDGKEGHAETSGSRRPEGKRSPVTADPLS